ncbi:MAG TPA: DUF2848 domain-containing protein [Candidatus Binataceae bacterium]|nr:DUF2848 domain-containing protein [Candidatus Binataceae bacterium]
MRPQRDDFALEFTAVTAAGESPMRARIESLVIAGWTGRDLHAVTRHIEELARMGVAPPTTTPIFYRAATRLLTSAAEIQVVGRDSSGEVEPVLVAVGDRLWVGVGSDHTDRKLETVGVTVAKQLCAKPLGAQLWAFDEIESHWDKLIIRCFALLEGRRRLYQQGTLSSLRPARELIALYRGDEGLLPAGYVMFCGTVAVEGEIAFADAYELELEDPVRRRSLSHRYQVQSLPVAG